MGVALPLLASDQLPNLAADAERSRETVAQMFDGTLCWDDLEWIRSAWDGPIALKGVLGPEEARRAADQGVDALIVSNHGGRQLDHVPATLEVLPDIVEAVGDRMEVLMDSGIRRGSDILTALALGARAVLVGRAHLYGLAAAGEHGVRHAIDIVAEELRMAMALSGAVAVDDLEPGMLRQNRPPRVGGPRDDGNGTARRGRGSHASTQPAVRTQR